METKQSVRKRRNNHVTEKRQKTWEMLWNFTSIMNLKLWVDLASFSCNNPYTSLYLYWSNPSNLDTNIIYLTSRITWLAMTCRGIWPHELLLAATIMSWKIAHTSKRTCLRIDDVPSVKRSFAHLRKTTVTEKSCNLTHFYQVIQSGLFIP